MISAYINWVVGRPWTVIIISMILVAISGIGMSKLAFRTDHRLFFAEDNPELLNFVEVEKTYTKNDNILFVVTAKNGNIFDRETMEVLLDLTAEGWTLPRVRRVDSITNFQNSRAEGDDIAIDNLVLRKADLTPEYLGEIRQTVLNEPLLVNRLVAPKGDVAGVVATFEIEDHEKDEVVHAIVDKARAYQARLKRDAPGVELRLSGSVMMDNAFAEASASDMSTLLPLMIVIIIVLSGVLLRSAAGAALTLVVVLCSVVVAMGLAGFIGIPLSPPSSVAPSIILTLATAECVHIVWSCVRAMHLGLCRRDAVAAALKANFRPLFLTASTTVVGFLTMNSAEAPPFIHLGNITAIGVTASYLLTISFLPAALTKVRMEKSSEEPPFIARISHWCSGLVRRHATGLAWGGLALTLTISSAAFLNKFDDRFVEYFDRSIEFRRDTDYVNDRLTGIYYIDYSLEAGAEHGVTDPIYLSDVDRFAAWFRTQPEVLHVFAFTDIMKRINRNMHGDKPDAYALPESRELSAQYLLLYEMSLPSGLTLKDRIDIGKSATRMTVTLRNISTEAVLSLEQRARDWANGNLKILRDPTGTGTTMLFSHIGQRNISNMMIGTFVGLIVISFLLIFCFRPFRVSAIAMATNLLPAGVTLGVWGLAVGEVGMAVSVIASMTLGIVVDDTIHWLEKFLHARRDEGMNASDSAGYAFDHAGPAMLTTSIVLAIGFGSLSLSSFQINSWMGMMTAFTLLVGIAVDYFVNPALLIKTTENLKC
jgi:uncharacterized protein